MITEKDKTAILNIARLYGIQKVFLFGSSADPKKEARDIDLGIVGLEPRRFFEFYGNLMFSLSKPVDIIDLSKESRFNTLVKREGIAIYG